MSDQDTWQWVDEDPIEKLFRLEKTPIQFDPPEPVLAESYLEAGKTQIEETSVEEPADSDPAVVVAEHNDWSEHLTLAVCPEETPATAQVEEPRFNEAAISDPAAVISKQNDLSEHFNLSVHLEKVAANSEIEEPRIEPAADTDSAATIAKRKDSSEHFDLAVSLEKTAQWKDAADFYRLAFEIDPSRYDALLGLGACLLHLLETEEALDCFDRHISAVGNRGPALLGRAVALQKLMRYEEADRVYQDVLQSDPNSAEVLGNLIALSVARNDVLAISEYSHRLLDADPRSKPALQGLATLAIRRGDQEAAIEYCERLVEVDPDNLEGWFNLGLAQQMMHPRRQDRRSIA